MRIARPILLVTTPIGVVFGLREAWRLAGPGMMMLMLAMLGVVSALVWATVRIVRRERALEAQQVARADSTRDPAKPKPG